MHGTPVLGANIGGIPELIRVGETGELFESGNEAGLILQIENMWKHRKEVGFKAARFTTVEQYTEAVCNVLSRDELCVM